MVTQDQILLISEVSEMTRIPVNTLRWMRHVEKGPRSAKLAGRIVYKESVVRQWIEDQFAQESA